MLAHVVNINDMETTELIQLRNQINTRLTQLPVFPLLSDDDELLD